MAITAGAVMDDAAALLNDPSKAEYSYSVQLPYLKIAYGKFLLYLQNFGITVLEEVSTPTSVAANSTTISSPADLIQPISLAERPSGSTGLYTPVEKVSDLPQISQVQPVLYWEWREETININPPLVAREVLIRYYKALSSIVDQSTTIPVKNCQQYLATKTAALCARYIGENQYRADALEVEAGSLLDLTLSPEIKSQQATPVRRKGYGSKLRNLSRIYVTN